MIPIVHAPDACASAPAPASDRISRKTARLVAVVIALMALIIALAPSGAHAAVDEDASLKAKPAATMMTINTSAKTVKTEGAVHVNVLLRDKKSGKNVPNIGVDIQQRERGASSWKTIKSTKTDHNGRATVRVSALKTNQEFRAVSKGTSAYAATTSKLTTVKVRQILKITSTTGRQPEVGSKVTVKGVTSAGLVGRTVALQTQVDAKWTTIGTATVKNDRTYSASGKLSQVGKRNVRVVQAGSSATDPIASTAQKFTVYEWYSLDTIYDYDSYWLYPGGPASIAGAYYNDSLWGWGDPKDKGWIEYNLNAKCMKFEAYIGLEDGSDSGAKRAFSARLNSGSPTLLGTKSTGAAATRVAMLTNGAKSLRLEYGSTTGNTKAWNTPVFGNARVGLV